MSSNLYYDEETLPMLSSGDSMPRARDRDSKKNIRYLVYCLILLAGLLAGFTAGLWKIRVSQTETPSAPEPPPPTILDSYQITYDDLATDLRLFYFTQPLTETTLLLFTIKSPLVIPKRGLS